MESLAFLLSAPRMAFGLKALLPVWIWIEASKLPCLCLDPPAVSIVPWVVWGAGLLFIARWISVLEARGRTDRLAPRDLLRGTCRGFAALVYSCAATLVTPALFVAIALAGALLSRVPWVGSWLAVAWMASAGVVLCLLGAAWLTAGVPALLLQAPASVIEAPHSFEVTSRTLSYVRRRPLCVTKGFIMVALSSALGTIPFVLFLSLGMVFFQGMVDLKEGWSLDLLDSARGTLGIWGRPDVWDLRPTFGSAVEGCPSGPAVWLILAARLAPAFLVAAVFSGLTRLYLLLRLRIDGVPIDRMHDEPEPAVD